MKRLSTKWLRWYTTPNAMSACVLIVFILVGIGTLNDFGLNWDEPGNIHYGNLLLSYYTSGFDNTEVFRFANLYYYGGAFDLSTSAISSYYEVDVQIIRRAMGLSIGTFGLFVAWWNGRRIGGDWGGFLTLITLATWPLYFGHSMINSKDLPFAVAMLGICTALVAAFDRWPKPCTRHWVALGVALGLAFGLRVGAAVAGIVFIWILLAYCAYILPQKGWRITIRETSQFVFRLSPALLIMLPITIFFWPWVVQNPHNIIEALQLFSKFTFDGSELFNGIVQPAKTMPWYYVPLLLLYQAPEGLIIIAPILLILLAYFRPKLPFSALIILSFALIPLLWIFAFKPTLYNGLRHALFIVPPLFISVCALCALMVRHVPVYIRPLLISILSISWVLGPMHTMRLHPYEYAAFNNFIGGVRGAQPRFAVEYWGISLKEAADLLEVHQPKVKKASAKDLFDPPWLVWVCGEDDTIQNELAERFSIAPSPEKADYIIALNAFYCKDFRTKPILFEVEREAAVFATVYEGQAKQGR